jgi:hypothetical protein
MIKTEATTYRPLEILDFRIEKAIGVDPSINPNTQLPQDGEAKKKRLFSITISSERRDEDGEVVRQDGMDTEYFGEHGVIKWEHNELPSHLAVIGQPVRIIRQGPKTKIIGQIMEGTSVADNVWELMEAMGEQFDRPRIGASIEGSYLDKAPDGDVLRSKVVNVVLTLNPKNTDTQDLQIFKSINAKIGEAVAKDVKKASYINDTPYIDTGSGTAPTIENPLEPFGKQGSIDKERKQLDKDMTATPVSTDLGSKTGGDAITGGRQRRRNHKENMMKGRSLLDVLIAHGIDPDMANDVVADYEGGDEGMEGIEEMPPEGMEAGGEDIGIEPEETAGGEYPPEGMEAEEEEEFDLEKEEPMMRSLMGLDPEFKDAVKMLKSMLVDESDESDDLDPLIKSLAVNDDDEDDILDVEPLLANIDGNLSKSVKGNQKLAKGLISMINSQQTLIKSMVADKKATKEREAAQFAILNKSLKNGAELREELDLVKSIVGAIAFEEKNGVKFEEIMKSYRGDKEAAGAQEIPDIVVPFAGEGMYKAFERTCDDLIEKGKISADNKIDVINAFKHSDKTAANMKLRGLLGL